MFITKKKTKTLTTAIEWFTPMHHTYFFHVCCSGNVSSHVQQSLK